MTAAGPSSSSLFRLDGDVAIVTGAGAGLGHAIAVMLADAGASVIAADMDAQAAQRTAEVIAAAGGKAAAFRFANALQIMRISNNLGDAKSLITHPATTTHRAMGPEGRAAVGLTDGVVRLSVGLEDTADLLADLKRALG